MLDYFGPNRLLDPILRMLEYYEHYDCISACLKRYNRTNYFSIRTLTSLNFNDLFNLKGKSSRVFTESEVLYLLFINPLYKAYFYSKWFASLRNNHYNIFEINRLISPGITQLTTSELSTVLFHSTTPCRNSSLSSRTSARWTHLRRN